MPAGVGPGRSSRVRGERGPDSGASRNCTGCSNPIEDARTIHVILDNYIIHKSRLALAWLAEHGRRLKLHFLPPYCPNENRIERIWLDLHANVTRNQQQRTIGALLEKVHAYLGDRFYVERRLMFAA